MRANPYRLPSRFLEGVQHEFSLLRKGGLYGPAAAIGSLFKLLKSRRQRLYPRHASFAPVRSFVADFVLNHFALRPGDEFLGGRIGERRLHSVWSLSEETGLNPHRLKKVLHGFGVIDDRQMAYSFHKIAFDVRAGLEAVELERQSLAIPEVAKRIGATAADAAQVVVMPAEVEAFRKTYISAWLLAPERGMHPTTVRRAMDAPVWRRPSSRTRSAAGSTAGA